MKRLATVLGILFVVAVAVGMTSQAIAGGKTHDVKATVVSVDIEHKQITIKDEAGAEHPAPVMGKAVAELKGLKAGDAVTVTCHDNEKGEHEGVEAIKKG